MPQKKAVKKVAKKTIAKRRSRPVKVEASEAIASLDTRVAVAEAASDAQVAAIGQALHAAIAGDGQFSANGALNLNIRSAVQNARGEVVRSIRNLVQASIDLSDSASASQSARDVATAQQRLAVAQVELALDGLESAVRG